MAGLEAAKQELEERRGPAATRLDELKAKIKKLEAEIGAAEV
jgi:hypothetical protein